MISGDPYLLELRAFRVVKYDGKNLPSRRSTNPKDEVPMQVVSVYGGTLTAEVKLGEKYIEALVAYTITVSMVAPFQMGETWTFRTEDGGQLPTNTNDGEQGQLRPDIVAPFDLKVGLCGLVAMYCTCYEGGWRSLCKNVERGGCTI